jgi:ectoine hydroxylase-related dioxygenase (phytanoyl-CoA dioxygenase family)
MPKVLSADAIRQFNEQGFLSPVPVLNADEVAYFRGRLEAFERAHPADVKKLKTKSHIFLPWVQDMARHERLLDVYEDLLGPDILCYSMAWRIKNADGKTFAGWHQDAAYSPIKPILVIGALALGNCGPEQGCLKVIPGSHKGRVLTHSDSTDPDSILARGQYISEEFDTSTAVDIALRPGEICLFNSACIHGSGTNTSNERRIMLLVEMMPAAVEERRHRDSATLVRGVDRFHNYDEEFRPTEEFGPAEQAAWHALAQKRARNVFHNSALPVSEAYGGATATAPRA